MLAFALNIQAQVKTPSWSDAPSIVSATLGYTSLDYQNPSSMVEAGVDMSWKFIYFGGSFAYGKKDGVDEGASNLKLGAALPIQLQNGQQFVVNPYIVIASTSYKYGGVTESDLAIGPGVKVNYVLPSNFVIGGFFQQPFTTDDRTENTMNTTLGVSVGYKF